MLSIASAAIDLHTSPQDVPTLPAWCAEVTVLARHFAHRDLLETISQQVHLGRGRMGHYEVIDFVALLLGYAVSGEPPVETFFERVAPFAGLFMALFGRERLPHRATLSRFLAAVDAPCLEALRQLFEHDLAPRGPTGEQGGGLVDRQGHRLFIFDVDGTRQAARQRALATSADLPPPRRRMATVCAPGYTGRKRGEVVRTRTTVLQAHTQQWLGTFGGAGNGDYSGELLAACQVIVAYLRVQGLPVSQGLLRLDGLYGTSSLLARIQRCGLGFVVRGRDYQLLTHPRMQARLQLPCDQEVQHPETGVQREIYDVGFIGDWLEPLPELALTCRVIVTRRPAPVPPQEVGVGKLIGDHVYELFLISHPALCLTAADVLTLDHQRGAFEQVLSDEDHEQEADRWCSCRASGQEFWQILSQWVWNTRLELGQVGHEPSVQWTEWAVPAPPSATAPAQDTAVAAVPVEEETVNLYGPPEPARTWAKARGRFAGHDFPLHEDGTLECPAGKTLRLRERRTLTTGDLRLLYMAKATDCQRCPLTPQCLGRGASGEYPRRVSVVRRLLGRQPRPQCPPEQMSEHAPPVVGEQGQGALLWGALSGRGIRRRFVALLRRQTLTMTRVPPAAPPPGLEAAPRRWTRAERAHRRLSWADRLTRNASAARTPAYAVTLFGINPALAAYLGLPSALAS